MELLDRIISEAISMEPVPMGSALFYESKLSELTEYVDRTMSEHSSVNSLIGNNPLQMMCDNHRHHGLFMVTVFKINDFELLAKTVPWVYRSYRAHGFSYDYFPAELNAWKQGLWEVDTGNVDGIVAVYDWMLEKHQDMVKIAESETPLSLPVEQEWQGLKDAFQSSLLKGDHKNCLSMAKEAIESPLLIGPFYTQVIQPALTEIGALWEKAQITVAQEHLASSIVTRVMSAIYVKNLTSAPSLGRVIITASPNEFHEIGAWMISDLLELNGWEVAYLGANTPEEDLIRQIKDFKPYMLVLSVTIPFNIDKAASVIKMVKQDHEISDTRIMVGGRAFNEVADLWKKINADGMAANAQEAVLLAGKWWANEKKDAN